MKLNRIIRLTFLIVLIAVTAGAAPTDNMQIRIRYDSKEMGFELFRLQFDIIDAVVFGGPCELRFIRSKGVKVQMSKKNLLITEFFDRPLIKFSIAAM